MGNLGAPVRFMMDEHEDDQPYMSEDPLLAGLRETTIWMQKRDLPYQDLDLPSVIDIKAGSPR